MQLSFPKGVIVENQRLSGLYYFLFIAVFVALIVRATITDQLKRSVPVGQHIQISMWPTGASVQGVEDVVATNLQSDFCQNPENLAYQWDEAGSYMYDNYLCYDVCRVESDRSECLDPKETYLKESATQIYFVTEIEDTWQGEDTKFRFVPMTEALGLQFTYSFSVPQEGLEGSSQILDHEVLTVILDHNGEPSEVIKPSPYIDMPLDKMLRLAGDRNRLEKSNPKSGKNHLYPEGSDEHNAGPSYRISGVEIVLDTSCYNELLDGIVLGPDPDTGNAYTFDQGVCYITVAFRDTDWVSAEQLHLSDGGRMLHRYYHGIRVSFQRGGAFEFLDPNNVFMAIVDAIVLLDIPKKIVLFFMINFLGSVSKIYRRVFYEPLNIMNEIGAVAVRLMGQSEWFVELEDQGDGSNDGTGSGQAVQRGISQKRMEERLRQALMAQKERLDAQELQELVNVCFQAVTERHQIAKKSARMPGKSFATNPGKQLRSLLSIAEIPDETDIKAISLENFVVSCSSNEVVEVETIVELFDRDRHLGRLESFFMPRKVANRVKEQRHNRESRVTVKPTGIGSANEPSNNDASKDHLPKDDQSKEHPSKDDTSKEEPIKDLPSRKQEHTKDVSRIVLDKHYAGPQSLTLEQRKALSFKNELKIQELMSWKEKEVSQSIKLLELRVSQLAEELAAKLTGVSACGCEARRVQAVSPPDVAELASRVSQLEACCGLGGDLRPPPPGQEHGSPAKSAGGSLPRPAANPDAAAGLAAQDGGHTRQQDYEVMAPSEVVAEFDTRPALQSRDMATTWGCCRAT